MFLSPFCRDLRKFAALSELLLLLLILLLRKQRLSLTRNTCDCVKFLIDNTTSIVLSVAVKIFDDEWFVIYRVIIVAILMPGFHTNLNLL